MIVAIHQPNYLPWLGFFYKMYACDVFVFHDAVAFSDSAVTKRVRIRKAKGSTETCWLSVPVQAHPSGAEIRRIQVDQSRDWTDTHLRKITNTYVGAPCYHQYTDWLTDCFEVVRQFETLADINQYLIQQIAKLLGLTTEFRTSDKLNLKGTGSALNLAITQAIGGTTYLAGTGSLQYEDDRIFQQAGIAIQRHDLGTWLEAHPYDQGTTTFVNGLSVLDALMHVGKEGVLEIFKAFQSQTH